MNLQFLDPQGRHFPGKDQELQMERQMVEQNLEQPQGRRLGVKPVQAVKNQAHRR